MVATQLVDADGRQNLTQSQLLMWTGQQLNPDSPLYNMAIRFSIDQQLEPKVFQRAFRSLAEDADAFRIVVDSDDGLPFQRLRDDVPRGTELLDGRQLTSAELDAFCKERVHQKFDLAECNYDSILIQVTESSFEWLFVQHHCFTDATSFEIIFRTLSERYEELIQKHSWIASKMPSFLDSVAQRKQPDSLSPVESGSAERQPLRFYGKKVDTPRGESTRVSVTLDSGQSQKLRSVARGQGFAAFSEDLACLHVFATALSACVYRITGSDSLRVGLPVHDRMTAGDRKTIGQYVDIRGAEFSVQPTETILSLASHVRNVVGQHLRERSPSGSAYAGINVVLNYLKSKFGRFAGHPVKAEWLHPGAIDSAHYLRVEVHDFDDSGRFTLLFDVNDDVFPALERQWLVTHFVETLNAILDDCDRPVSEFPLSLHHSGQSSVLAPEVKGSICEAFSSAANANPNRTAVTALDGSLSYSELNRRVNVLAKYLRDSHQVESGDRIAVITGRTSHMITAMLGSLRAGAAYVPIDCETPPERIRRMLDESNVSIILADFEFNAPMGEATPIIRLDSLSWNRLPQADDEPLPCCESLAYILYTSGSTGQPNGVMIEHGNVLSLVAGLKEHVYDQHNAVMNVGLVASVVFDASVQQIFASLLLGHTLHIVPDESRRDGARLMKFCRDHQLSVCDGTPAHLRLMVAADREFAEEMPAQWIIGGEDLPTELAEEFFGRHTTRHPTLTNIYGVAECCVDSTAFDVTQQNLSTIATDNVPIGRPLLHAQVSVVDENRQMLPVGVPGQILISGPGVGRGYLNGDDASNCKFTTDDGSAGQRKYLTGDRGRYLSSGDIQFLGRLDDQVKIRGHRIEPGEIEFHVRKFKAAANTSLSTVTDTDEQSVKRCRRCVLTDRHPEASLDPSGLCSVCREYEQHHDLAEQYFHPETSFEELVQNARQSESDYDCMLLYSGGKDSSYVLHRLVEMGLRVLAYTFDNGFISRSAFENIRRQTTNLGVDSIVTKSDRMDDIFVESLTTDSTVCDGCFKALTTISTRIAAEHGISTVITGLSRGQIVDTKLIGQLRDGVSTVDQIEKNLLLFRQMFHGGDDRMTRLVGDSLSDIDLASIQFVDFFRYDNRSVAGIRDFLAERDPWWRKPEDTGFCSSNCLMNDIGICVHSQVRGYHNYEAPISWDIRLGLSTRDEGLSEVAQLPNPRRTQQVLYQIGFFEKSIRDVCVLPTKTSAGHQQLTAFYVASQSVDDSELREWLRDRLPQYMMPDRFVQMDRFPLSPSGKVDRGELRRFATQAARAFVSAEPETEMEQLLVDLWEQLLETTDIGREHRFFDVGGDSLLAMSHVTSVNVMFGINLPLSQIFAVPALCDWATVVENAVVGADVPSMATEQDLTTVEREV